jgi:hypothetical protein
MLAWTTAAVATTIFMTLYNSDDYAKRMNFQMPPMEYRIMLLGLMAVSLVVCYVWEVRCSSKYKSITHGH